jgi:hypothetical protein
MHKVSPSHAVIMIGGLKLKLQRYFTSFEQSIADFPQGSPLKAPNGPPNDIGLHLLFRISQRGFLSVRLSNLSNPCPFATLFTNYTKINTYIINIVIKI